MQKQADRGSHSTFVTQTAVLFLNRAIRDRLTTIGFAMFVQNSIGNKVMGSLPTNLNFESLTGLSSALIGPLTVSQLTRMVRDTLKAVLPSTVSVTGQISNWRPSGNGHAWFTLKDEQSQLSCVVWADRLRRLKFQPADGLEVVASGGIDVYPQQGRYQLYVERLEPVGVGALELAFRQLYEKLNKEGLFDASHKKPLPPYPGTIALVTSPTGAAVRDIIRTVLRRWPAIRLIVVPVRVQGEKAAEEIATAISRVNKLQSHLGVDLMIVGRGGGSVEDLWAFNEEVVARAIYASNLPIISAVGHERDTTISDLVADARAATPTHAGEMAVQVLNEVVMELDDLATRQSRQMRDSLESHRLRLESLCKEPCLADPGGRLRQWRQILDRQGLEVKALLQQSLSRQAAHLAELQMRMQRVHPNVQISRHGAQVDEWAGRLRRAVATYHNLRNHEITAAASSLRQISPLRQVPVLGESLIAVTNRIEMAIYRALRGANEQMQTLQSRIEAGNPANILKRGFTITRDRATGKLITAATMARSGMTLTTQTGKGEFTSVVDGRAAVRPPPRTKPNTPDDHAQLTLPMEPPA